jgi:hypothetical protein
MNKKQYVMCLVGAFLVSVNFDLIKNVPDMTFYQIAIDLVASILNAIIYALMVSWGIGFSQKVGLRLLLLEGNFNFSRDILRPAMLVSSIYTGTWLIIKVLMISVVLIKDSIDSVLMKLFFYDTSLFLFGLSGCALLLKKIGKKMPMSIIMPISIFLVAFLYNSGCAMLFGGSLIIGKFRILIANFFCDLLLGILFWHKGFETAVLCHIFIAVSKYVILPIILSHYFHVVSVDQVSRFLQA